MKGLDSKAMLMNIRGALRDGEPMEDIMEMYSDLPQDFMSQLLADEILPDDFDGVENVEIPFAPTKLKITSADFIRARGMGIVI
jgi:hypothetical protein